MQVSVVLFCHKTADYGSIEKNEKGITTLPRMTLNNNLKWVQAHTSRAGLDTRTNIAKNIREWGIFIAELKRTTEATGQCGFAGGRLKEEKEEEDCLFICLIVNVPVNFEVISETALGTIESMLLHYDVRSACEHHTQSHYPDTGPTRLNTKSIMPDTRRISC
ncbi:hypothetical protein ElyMa_003917100 [Elysia marginata]|uniref:Uncharacterized protein n=1 Tax=Elysia marginata TaxID=1093978 RepID=A0AAV4FPX5_9GAST|nr:hypothetical protein ElyMa_003917100 [Elysia marginata]